MIHHLTRRRCPAILFVAIVSASLASAGEPRPIDPEDILNVRWGGQVALSPDAAQVAYLVMEPADSANPRSSTTTRLWIAAADRSSPPRLAALGHYDVRRPQWSPDGACLAFLSKGNSKLQGKQVWLLRTNGGLPTCLTQAPAGVSDYRWSPDGKEIAYIASPGDEADEDPVEVDHRHGRSRLWVVPAAGGAATAVTKLDRHIIEAVWSPTGTEFAAIVAPSDDVNDVFEHSKLVIVDRSTGEDRRTLNDNVADQKGLAWSPDGKTIAFMAFAPKHFAYRIALVSADGGPCRYPLEGFPGTADAVFASIRWSRESRYLFVPAFEATRYQLVRVDTTDGSIKRLAESVQNFWSWSISADETTLAFAAEKNLPPEVVVVREGKSPVQLTDLNPQLSECRLGDVKEISWRNKRDGKRLYGVLITPPDFVPDKPRPTIVQLHGGPQDMWWKSWVGTWLSWGQMLASHGYVVFLPDPRGSIGQGWQFSETIHRDWGGMDFLDVMDGIDALVAQGVADPDRLGVGGWSYGGFLTASATVQSDRFKAAIVGAGITDLRTNGLTTDITAWFRRMWGDADKEVQEELLQKHSPLTGIDRCKTPTLVLHGENDKRSPLYQGRAWYQGLKRLGVETEMVIYPREGHFLAERAHQLDVMRRVLEWYDRHLKKG